YDATRKTAALRDAAASLRLEWFLPELSVTFAAPGREPRPGEPIPQPEPNLHGTPRETCRLCAECCFGCNHGSKNSLDLNYLSAAARLGAEIRPLCEVRELRPRDGGGYVVRYVEHDLAREGRSTATHDTSVLPLRTVTADQLLLAAGTFGSTYLLLRNRASLPGLSETLGDGFSVNGDFLAFAVKCSTRTPWGRRRRVVEADVGTAITSAVRIPAQRPEDADSYVEDMGYPAFLSWLLQIVDVENAVQVARRVLPRVVCDRFFGRTGRLDADVASLFGSSALSASLLPMIGVGRDAGGGMLALRRDRLVAVWDQERSAPYYRRALGMARALATALGARYWDTHRRAPVTMHPLGGCPMGTSAQDGVVDSYGEVFNHPGLFIADGSVMPAPIGVNPSLTIAAVADRTADRMLGLAPAAAPAGGGG
ncbi:MAG TPA: GMC oxidoreductase, partial [Solirubrobacteraceae bacterium]|nr:GMC oxidoreductase [Solirubrobacteraceae bacterium]